MVDDGIQIVPRLETSFCYRLSTKYRAAHTPPTHPLPPGSSASPPLSISTWTFILAVASGNSSPTLHVYLWYRGSCLASGTPYSLFDLERPSVWSRKPHTALPPFHTPSATWHQVRKHNFSAANSSLLCCDPPLTDAPPNSQQRNSRRRNPPTTPSRPSPLRQTRLPACSSRRGTSTSTSTMSPRRRPIWYGHSSIAPPCSMSASVRQRTRRTQPAWTGR